VLAECTHENLCQFEGVYETENTAYVVMESYEKTLSSLLQTARPLPRELVVTLMEQLLHGISHLHSRGVMHRDLKLENIMLHKTENGARLVIIDMGMAEHFQQ
jgi:serine/threonine protein kinase